MESDIKHRILQAAAEEIRDHGANFRMDDLARRVNISKRTLYEQFRSKNEIIEMIVIERAEDFYEQHQTIFADTSLTCKEALVAFFSVRSNLFDTLNGGHFRDMFTTIPMLIEKIMTIYEGSWNLLRIYLQEQMKTGAVKEFDVDVFIMMIQGVVRYVCYDKNRDPSELNTLIPQVLDMVLTGILTQKEEKS